MKARIRYFIHGNFGSKCKKFELTMSSTNTSHKISRRLPRARNIDSTKSELRNSTCNPSEAPRILLKIYFDAPPLQVVCKLTYFDAKALTHKMNLENCFHKICFRKYFSLSIPFFI